MAWPNNRLTTYAPGSAVRNGDLNELQDSVINAKHGDLVWSFPVNGHFQAVSGTWTTTGEGSVFTLASGADGTISIPHLREGDLILELSVRLLSGDANSRLRVWPMSAEESNILGHPDGAEFLRAPIASFVESQATTNPQEVVVPINYRVTDRDRVDIAVEAIGTGTKRRTIDRVRIKVRRDGNVMAAASSGLLSSVVSAAKAAWARLRGAVKGNDAPGDGSAG